MWTPVPRCASPFGRGVSRTRQVRRYLSHHKAGAQYRHPQLFTGGVTFSKQSTPIAESIRSRCARTRRSLIPLRDGQRRDAARCHGEVWLGPAGRRSAPSLRRLSSKLNRFSARSATARTLRGRGHAASADPSDPRTPSTAPSAAGPQLWHHREPDAVQFPNARRASFALGEGRNGERKSRVAKRGALEQAGADTWRRPDAAGSRC